jgi:hypothetical protein
MAFVGTQSISLAGTQVTYSAATVTTGDTFTPAQNVFLLVRNGGGAPITATIDVPGSTQTGEAQPEVVRTITNATDKVIGPFDPNLFIDPATNVAKVTWSAVTSVTFAVLKL